MNEDEEIQKALREDELPPPPPNPGINKSKMPDPATVGSVPQDASAYELMDRRDEEQILAELGELPADVLNTMVYSFKMDGRDVTGLSWIGVKTLVVELGQYSIEDLKVEETPETYRCIAKAIDKKAQVTMYGTAEQDKMMRFKDNERKDPFALQKASSKAQRNAFMAVLPKGIVEEFKKKCLAVNPRGPRVAYR
ncbi:MAG: hypothetical protein A2W25_04240 [candidate division Zixibacteria bacterium RBG_16_53_22]|nr:MAG: hypothetical protein A2W25_04240 [candidate division Zixibacteria bacterium RBG_16_53_22]